LCRPGRLSTIPPKVVAARRQAALGFGRRFVSSFVGVLGITLVLFLVVALTARLLLGR
jgi:hypothetical protein